MSRVTLFTSESVTEGHPDKMCDKISDAVLDAVLAQDPTGRVACETFITTGLVVVGGEITFKGNLDVPGLVRKTIDKIGYNKAEYGFDCNTCGVISTINKQSPDIAMGVDRLGAGDQGMMFGYACKETPELMPLPIQLAHKLTLRLTELRQKKKLNYLRPDGKSQVTVKYIDDKPVEVTTVVISTQHSAEVKNTKLHSDIKKQVIEAVIPKKWRAKNMKVYINPTGRFVVGGPMGDAGLTGRKIIVDTYGGYAPHGGGAFSGKDPTKVDRSAAYASRYVAKNIVAAGLADKCEVQLAYAIGVAEPVSVKIQTFGTCKLSSEEEIEKIVQKEFDLTPAGIIKMLDLRRPIYSDTAAYGHFGRKQFSWEKTDRAAKLRSKYLKKK